jgi:SAM-dependent methyltransferase
MLVPTGARVIAVEPLPEMRRKLRDVVDGVEVIDGTAESLPLAVGAAHVVTAAQAAHWFDFARALPELHRVLAPGGALVFLWNSRDLDDPLQRALEELIEPLRGTVIMQQEMEWRSPVEASGLFGRIEQRAFRFEQSMTVDDLVARVSSTSFVAAMTPSERDPLLDEVRALAVGRAEPFAFPYRTDVFVITRSSDHPSNERGTSIQG